MGIAEYSIKNKVVSWLVVVILVGGGLGAYEEMGKLEDPEFTIKEAKVFTRYPGANPQQVNDEVTYHVEDAVQEMLQLDRIKMSISREGFSEVNIEFQDKYRKAQFPQIYDELRRKIGDMQHKLPPGAESSIVYDEFGDVYGIFYGLTGDGYSYRDLKDYADLLKKELVLVPGVRKVIIGGYVDEVVYIELSRNRMSELGIAPESIVNVLQSQNVVADAGRIRVDNDYIRVEPTGESKSVKDIGDILISSDERRLIYLKDLATVRRGYQEVPNKLTYINGVPGLTIGISMVSGVNVVQVGRDLEKRALELINLAPVGIEYTKIYNQAQEVENSVNGFIISVAQALVIVIVVLLFFMGLRVGLIIGAVLLITVCGTLWFMDMKAIELQRISLGALIIALGMLVDNAIVVAEGMLVRIRAGMDPIKAGNEVVGQTIWPLLGGTVIGILAFSAIGLSQDATGEFINSLFWVILISLMLSWFTAITTTPLLCAWLIKPDKKNQEGGEAADAYSGVGFRLYRGFLAKAIRVRYLTVGIVVAFFVSSILGFGYVRQAFFPDSNTPIFFVDLWEVEGTDIRHTRDDLLKIDEFIRKQEGVVSTSAFVGGGADRFTLVYTPESQTTAYGQIIVEMENRLQIAALKVKIEEYMARTLPNTEPLVKNLRIGPGRDNKIEARFSGPDHAVLRELSEKAQAIYRADPEAKDIRDDWRQPVKLIRPVFNESVGRQLGITRHELAQSLQQGFEGSQVGLYRDGIRLLPMILWPPAAERSDVASIQDIQVWSPVLNTSVPVGQVVSEWKTVWENAIIRNRDRRPTIIASSNPKGELATPLFNRVKPLIEAIELPPGYILEWGGEFEDTRDAQNALFGALPGGFLMMILVTILLFGKLIQPLIIWLTVPLATIGITAGLLLTNGAFDFMALLGALSLVGLLIKNAIVLIEEIDLKIAEGMDPMDGILDAAVSRMRPVMMAASTTILGMIPLIPDVFFINMALTIMFGLGFATVLTLIIIPVLYAIFFRVPNPE
ncbi:efflux RND transporter permease subunit [Aestuariirhabdus sp. Z084]|uniref:efflux RND transporter permease subunit n=1 Tax=Aestuariirhabdus haliotis TaxID=2918751 RepID=UPI00201B3658|nr:efflux RND transporter permease subunit [Aestuariirhabdus haliotis]MCL6414334.1 efflux RND transporter permease subunit [Aestuariirhabdus haliotis]MCL6418266.1 efflux RND transporter permease subunit [Aestuariirhabdus haliotis]